MIALTLALVLGQTVLTPDAGSAFSPAIAVGDGVVLVVWQQEQGASADIRATRLAESDLHPLDTGIDVCAAPGEQRLPRVAFANGAFFVVWEDGRGADADVMGARVSPQGTVSPAVLLAGGAGAQALPDVETLGAEVLVVWQAEAAGSVAQPRLGRFASADLAPLSPPVTLLDFPGNGIFNPHAVSPRVVRSGNEALVVWAGRGQLGELADAIHGLRVGPGTEVEPTSRPLAGSASRVFRPAVAARADGGWWVVPEVWRNRHSNWGPGLVMGVAPAGTPEEPVGTGLPVGSARDVHLPSASTSGARTAIAFHRYVDDRLARQLRVDTVLVKLDAAGAQVGADVVLGSQVSSPAVWLDAAGRILVVAVRLGSPAAPARQLLLYTSSW